MTYSPKQKAKIEYCLKNGYQMEYNPYGEVPVISNVVNGKTYIYAVSKSGVLAPI